MSDDGKQIATLSAWLKVSQAILIPIAAWLGLEVWTMTTDLARVEERIQYIEDVQGRILGRIDLVAEDVATELGPSLQRYANDVDDNRARIQSLSAQVGRLEAQSARVSNALASLSEYVDRSVPDTTAADTAKSAWREYIENPTKWGNSYE